MGVGNGRVLSESGTNVVFLEKLVLVGEVRLLLAPQQMELQWMLGRDGCDGEVLKKDSDFLVFGECLSIQWMLHAGLRINSQHDFNRVKL